MAKQLLFPEFEKLKTKDFGGSLLKGNPRDARPISLKRPMHLVLRSSMAKGSLSFLVAKRSRIIRDLVHRSAKSQGVKIYRFANSGNHLHLIVLPQSRTAFLRFIRSVSGLIARVTLGAQRGNAKGLQFWDARPFTRILEWGKDYRRACAYLKQNILEALGFIPFQPRMPTGPKLKVIGARSKHDSAS
ncbi:MAG: transposase [Bdellovibrionales bacterium]|nr:transposase [Bdellovibrionales bacterium]